MVNYLLWRHHRPMRPRSMTIRHLGPVAALAAMAAALCGFAADARAANPVDVALVLAVDSSSSVSADEFYLQTQGLSVAFADPGVQAAIAAGPEGAIAVAIVEWADPKRQEVNVPWTIVRAENAGAFAAAIADMPRLVDGGGTALGAGLLAARALFAAAPPSMRRVVDVSGDGRTSAGIPAAAARDALVAEGIMVNGLAIVNEEPDLEAFYRDNLIGGPGAFVMRAADYSDFAEAIRQKLLREIGAAPLISRAPPAPHATRSAARLDPEPRAIDANDDDMGAGGKIGSHDRPRRVAETRAAHPVHQRLYEDAAPPDE